MSRVRVEMAKGREGSHSIMALGHWRLLQHGVQDLHDANAAVHLALSVVVVGVGVGVGVVSRPGRC